MLARREFIGLCGGLFAAWPYAAEALQSGKLPTIAYLGPTTPALDSYRLPAFMQRLRELGWIQGRSPAEFRKLSRISEKRGHTDPCGFLR